MGVEDFDKYMAVAKALNNSWGTGSQLRSQSQSIKFSLRDDKLMKVHFMMIVNMPADFQLQREMKERYKLQALAMIKGAIEELKERFVEQNDGETISLKMIDNSVTDGIEYLKNAQYSMNKSAYFRLDALIEVL